MSDLDTAVSEEVTGEPLADRLSQSEQDSIVRKFMPLVRQIARRYSQYNPDSHEDLVQVGSIGLLKTHKIL